MQFLRNWLDHQKPSFEKGGKYAHWHSTFEAFESFLFVPARVTRNGVHIRDCSDMKRTMMVVVVALMPALLFGMWNVGYQHALALGEPADFWRLFGFGLLRVVPIILVTYVVGLGIEFAVAQIRGHEVNEGFLVTGLLIPLIMPVDVPLWMVALATAFAVIIGKEIFGGTGMNVFNPALLARAFIFFAYPAHISGNKVWVADLIHLPADGYSGATPLARLAAGEMDKLASASDMFYGYIPGSIGETSVPAILLGAAILILTGVGSWKIMTSVLAGGLCMGWIFNIAGSNPYMEIPAYYHVIMGGFAFGAVFMATDPVTSAQTSTGKWIYGFLIGLFAVLIRVLNPAYPEGMMLSILFFNAFAPLIDYFVVQSNIRSRLKRAKNK